MPIMMNVHPLPPETYAIMVHKQFRDRVQEFLLSSSSSSATAAVTVSRRTPPRDDDATNSTPRNSSSSSSSNDETNSRDYKHQILLLDEPSLTGVSQSRRGTVLVLLKEIQRPVQDLSPMARQSCSWILKMTHEAASYRKDNGNVEQQQHHHHDDDDDDDSFINHLGRNLWQTLYKDYDFDSSRGDVLRVDVHPRNQVVAVCRALQQSAVAAVAAAAVQQEQSPVQNIMDDNDKSDHHRQPQNKLDDDDDPFESGGPIEFTRSRSKCTHRLGLILLHHPITPSPTETLTSKEETAAATTTRQSCQNNGSKINKKRKKEDKNSFHVFYWGVDRRPLDDKRMDLALNHEAADEIQVVPSLPACYNNNNNNNNTSLLKSKSTCPPPPAKVRKRNNNDSVSQHHQHQQEDREDNDDNNNNNNNTQEVPATVPVSRAYYKLHQVWTDYLSSSSSSLLSSLPTCAAAAALDLGASPGGWTQVLVHDMGYRRVVAVDPANLAPRVVQQLAKNTALVTHVQANLHRPNCRKSFQENTTTNNDIAAAHTVSNNNDADDDNNNDTARLVKLLLPHGPYSMVVCDASMLWPQILDSMEEWAHAMMKSTSHTDKNSTSSGCSGIFALPSTWVITMKLPFKTLGSIKRNVQQIKERVGLIEPAQQPNPKTGSSSTEEKSPPPSWLDQIARHLCMDKNDSKKDDDDDDKKKKNSRVAHAVHWKAQVVHLMANSDSERTLIATFFEHQEPV